MLVTIKIEIKVNGSKIKIKSNLNKIFHPGKNIKILIGKL